jgi:hypothetical protein
MQFQQRNTENADRKQRIRRRRIEKFSMPNTFGYPPKDRPEKLDAAVKEVEASLKNDDFLADIYNDPETDEPVPNGINEYTNLPSEETGDYDIPRIENTVDIEKPGIDDARDFERRQMKTMDIKGPRIDGHKGF